MFPNNGHILWRSAVSSPPAQSWRVCVRVYFSLSSFISIIHFHIRIYALANCQIYLELWLILMNFTQNRTCTEHNEIAASLNSNGFDTCFHVCVCVCICVKDDERAGGWTALLRLIHFSPISCLVFRNPLCLQPFSTICIFHEVTLNIPP